MRQKSSLYYQEMCNISTKTKCVGLSTSLCIYFLIIIFYNSPLKAPLNGDRDSKAQANPNRSLTILLEPCTCSRTINTNWTTSDITLLPNSNCGRWSTLRGTGQKIVSYSVYGEFPTEYHKGLEHLVSEVKQFYPGWIMRVYHNEDIWHSEKWIQWACSLACNNPHLDFCDISSIPDLGNINTTWGSLWRFAVIGDSTVSRYIVRDLDSPILQREVDAVNEWIDSGKCYHVMRDNHFHGVPMMAGMWGGCNSWHPPSSSPPAELRRQMLRYGTKVSQDQPALWKFMWPQVKENVIAHDSFTCMKFSGSKPFPTKREGNTFIGMRTYKKQYEHDGIWRPCPDICRPKDHQDWELC